MSILNAIAEHGAAIANLSTVAIYVSLVIIYFWFGGMKFTAYEAKGLVPLVSNSLLIGWIYRGLGERRFAIFLGCIEISVGLLIAARLFSPEVSVFGGVLSMGLFFVTLSLMFSTPGVVEPNLGFPAITVEVGQFLIKDVGLLAASLWVVGESLLAINALP
ncbi:MAG: YkgB family protein [Nitrococcus sp.]|nr:YkgB family protein [Nitrococcus sp.]